MKRSSALLWPLFVLLASSRILSAATIYDNGTPDKRNGAEMTHWMEADNFSLTDPSRLETLTFWDFEQSGFFAGTLLWQIYSDDGSGRPANLLLSGTSRNVTHAATGFMAFGGFYEYTTTFDIGPISLPRGSYWLALHNGGLSNGANGTVNDWNFYWESSAAVTGPASHYKTAPYTGFWWSNVPPDLAFQLTGVAAPRSLNLSVDPQNAQLSFTTTAGFAYRVEFKDGLVNSSWNSLPGADRINGTGDIIQLTDTDAGNRSRRFYRVTLLYDGIGAPAISSFSLANSAFQVSFTTAAGYLYRVEYKNDLGDLSWTPVTGAETIEGTGNIIQINDPSTNPTARLRRIYRVTLL